MVKQRPTYNPQSGISPLTVLRGAALGTARLSKSLIIKLQRLLLTESLHIHSPCQLEEML